MRITEFNEIDLMKMTAEELIQLAENQILEMIEDTDKFIEKMKISQINNLLSL